MSTELVKILHELVLENRIPAKALAKEIGKPYSTLLREINPYDNGAKLGVETLLQLMKATSSVAPLEYMADQMGYALAAKTQSRQDDSFEKTPVYSHSTM
ncbi:amino acid-binding protein [Desulfovibrio sp. OttesenSCG-928-C06]|nr:amino acid-binding protein [Desulfovibrio sp. OttesenSCG-928-C06]